MLTLIKVIIIGVSRRRYIELLRSRARASLNDHLVILSDTRIPMILAALVLQRQTKATLVTSEAIFEDDAFVTSLKGYRYLKIVFLLIYGKLLIVPSRKVKTLDTADSSGVRSSVSFRRLDPDACENRYPDDYAFYKNIECQSLSILRFVRFVKCKRAYLFNGRLASTASLSVSLAYRGVQVYYYEYGTQSYHFTLTNYPCYQAYKKVSRLLRHRTDQVPSVNYCFADRPQNVSLCSSYAQPILSVFKEGDIYNRFKSSLTPSNQRRYDIVFFLSSQNEDEDEKYMGSLFLLKKVESVCRSYRGSSVCIVAHPNTQIEANWRELSGKLNTIASSCGASYIAPDDPRNVMDLIRHAKVVHTTFSSVAVSAFLLGKKVFTDKHCPFGMLISHVSSRSFSSDYERVRYFIGLLLTLDYVDQVSLPLKFSLLQKALSPIDNLFSPSRHFGSSHPRKYSTRWIGLKLFSNRISQGSSG